MNEDRIPEDLDLPPSAALSALSQDLRSATADVGERDDFDAIFAKIGTAPDALPAPAPAPVTVVPFARRRSTRVGAVVTTVFAAAAAFFLVAGKKPIEQPVVVLQPPVYAPVGTVAPHAGEGLTLSGGHAAAGAELREGTTLAAARRASFVRPGKVRWLLEGNTAASGATASILEGREALRVSLETGAVEAEVTPVVKGEAFSVDVAGTRVAVHGTHLRVARIGDTVTIDLSHGVIALGTPGKARVEGPEITAPAHIEFPVGHPEQKTVRTTDVRAPELFDDLGDVVTAPAEDPPALVAVTPKEARKALVDAVDACSRKGPAASDAVQITVSSTATLTFADDGKLKATRFYPPLRPDIHACVANRMNAVAVRTADPITVPVRFTFR